MLFLAIGFCASLVVAANLAVSRTKMPRTIILTLCVLTFLGQDSLAGLFLPAVFYLEVFLVLAVFCGATDRKQGPLSFRSISIAAVVLALGLSGYQAWRTERGYARLREKYSLESLEGRVPLLPVSTRKPLLTPESLARLDSFENRHYHGYQRYLRTHRLARLHENSVQTFIMSFGFGVGRMSPREPSELNLALPEAELAGHAQPGPRPVAAGSPGDWSVLPADQKGRLGSLLDQAFAQFGDPQTFGYFRDRRHVAGFAPHQVREAPKGSDDWQLQTLDLVGLLLHDEPIVYMSSNLPKMDELRGVPTRALDRFEVAGLETLRGGEDIMIVRDGEVARMVGAIRSTTDCLPCHGGSRGELLGAFSYALKPVQLKAVAKTAMR